MNKAIKITMAIMVLISTVLSIVSIALIAIYSKKGTYEDKGKNVAITDIQENGIKLMPVASTSSDGYPTEILTATIMPAIEGATINWSLEWSLNKAHEGKEPTEFITLLTSGNNCTLKCIKAFDSDIISVKAVSPEFNKSASCSVKFTGKAQAITVKSDVYKAKDNTLCLVESSDLITVELNNIFNSVKNCELTYSIKGVGELYVCKQVSAEGSSTYSDFRKMNLATDFDCTKLFDIAIVGNKVTIKLKTDAFSFWANYRKSEEFDGIINTTYTDAYVLHASDEDMQFNTDYFGIVYTAEHKEAVVFNRTAQYTKYFTITITDSVTGISTAIKVDARDMKIGLNTQSVSF